MPSTTATTITMPQLGESVTEGMVGNWLKAVGDLIEKYEPLVEVTTDKVNSEIPSPVSGVLVEILVDPETTVPVGAGICRIEEAGASAAESGSMTSNVVQGQSEPAPVNGADTRLPSTKHDGTLDEM